MESRSTMFRIALAAMCLLLSACAVRVERPAIAGPETLVAEDLLTGSPIDGAAPPTVAAAVDILALSPAMDRFLDENVRVVENQNEQLRHLAWAIMRSGDFTLVYDDSTRTAADTFAMRRGNCMSFTNLFIALARELGLDARYQEVEVPPNWSMSGESFLYSQHVNVLIDLNHGRTRIVDFNLYDFDTAYPMWIVSDARGRAHFYNNIGAEKMLADEPAAALAYFRRALREDPEFGPSWINLGLLHRRAGFTAHAEVALLHALELDHDNLMAMSNLVSLYEEAGETERAAAFAAKVHSHRMKNPYYRYQLADQAFAEGDYETAIHNLAYAIRRRRNEDAFYYLMSLSYLMSGRRDEATQWMKKAEEVAAMNSDRQRYSYKLDLLQEMNRH